MAIARRQLVSERGGVCASTQQRRRAREQARRCVGVCGGVGEHGSMAGAGGFLPNGYSVVSSRIG